MEANADKAKKVLGWEAEYSIEDGLRKFLKHKKYIE